jgi:hypothetical protein
MAAGMVADNTAAGMVADKADKADKADMADMADMAAVGTAADMAVGMIVERPTTDH